MAWKREFPDIPDYEPTAYNPVPIRTYEFDLKSNLTMKIQTGKEILEHKIMNVSFHYAVKYSDVDYINRTLSVERQLGKKLNRGPKVTDNIESNIDVFTKKRGIWK